MYASLISLLSFLVILYKIKIVKGNSESVESIEIRHLHCSYLQGNVKAAESTIYQFTVTVLTSIRIPEYNYWGDNVQGHNQKHVISARPGCLLL